MIVKINQLKRGSTQTIAGEVVRLIDEDEFILRDGSRRIKIEVDLPDDRRLPILQGETVTVIGRLDNDDFEFDGFRVTRENGTSVFDRLKARAASDGDDVLVGGEKRDILTGGAGKDTLVGRFGRDLLTGGAGRDRFVYENLRDGGDRIADFSIAQDVIDVSRLLVDSQYTSSQPFTAYLNFKQIGSRTVVQIDPDGDTGSIALRTLVTLDGVASNQLTANNFAF